MFSFNDLNSDEYSFNCCYTDISEFTDLQASAPDNFNIFSQNIRSFDKNYDALSVFLNNLNSEIEIIILTETWFSNFHSCDIEGYKSYHVFRSEKRGGGVSIYVRNTIKSVIVSEKSCMYDFIECLTVQVSGLSNSLSVVGVYRPPSGDIDMFFEYIYSNLLEYSNSRSMLIGGDLNIDILESSNISDRLMNIFNSYNFYPLVTVPTRVTDNSSKCIDHIWYNSFNVNHSGCFVNDITDHFLIYTSLNFSCNKSFARVKFRDHSEMQINLLKLKFDSIVNSFYENRVHLDVNERCQLFIEMFWDCYNKCCPIKYKVLSTKRLNRPWLTNELINCINRKHSLFRDYKNNLTTRNNYVSYKNNLCTILKDAKANFYKRKFDSCKNDLRKTWKSINRLTRGYKQSDPITLLDDSGIEQDDPKNVSNLFCKYFSSVASDLDDKIPISDVNPLDNVKCVTDSSFFIFPSSPCEIHKLIMSMPNKSCNTDSIPIFIYKLLVDKLSVVLSDIFNISVSTGIFPQCLKIARIIPIYKANLKSLASNYRPISLTHNISKLFEKLMCNRMWSFIDKNNILNNCQFGFRRNLSTTDAVLQVVDDCIDSIDKNKYVIAVFLDLAKAFDTVNHEILLSKLDKLGFRGIVNSWFRSFLCDRRIVVDVNGELSAERSVNIGVPQGTVSAALLFILYINDLSNVSDNLKFVMFADDTTVYASGASVDELSTLITNELKKVDSWLTANRLSLNLSKTCYMLFNKKRNDPEVRVNIRGKPINRVSRTSFLGVRIDDRLSFNYHVEHVKSKLSRALGIMYKLCNIVPDYILMTLYYSIFYPHIIFSITVWGNSNKNNINVIKSLQRRAFKIIFYNDLTLLNNHSFMTFDNIYAYFILVKFFKCITMGHHEYFILKFYNFLPNHGHMTRFNTSYHFNTPKFNKALGQKFFFYQGIHLYNKLSDILKDVRSLALFKKQLKTYFVENQLL